MCRKLLYLIAVMFVLSLAVDGQAADLAHRWSFNGDLKDSVGGKDAVIVDLGASNAILSDTEITLTGGGKGTSDYIDLPDGIVSSLGDAVTFEAWATQISVQNWSRIFDFGTSTSENVFMSWTSGTTLNADRVEWLGPNDSDTQDNTNAPYTRGVEFHIVCVFDTGLVTWYTGPADSDTLGEAKGSFQSTNRLSELNDTNNWLGRSQWEDSTANASWNEVRLWKGALTPEEIEKYHRMGPDGINPNIAVAPSPADGATDVPREVSLGWGAGESAATHDVYLGTSFADVDAASRSNPLGVLVSQGQAGTTYTPAARLEFETTYYWRIDEVNAAPDNTVFKGEVWSFTTEPFTYPVANIIATSNAPNVEAETGPENTVNGSGLDAAGKHSIQPTDMWLAAGSGEPVWLQCEFDSVYKIHEMRVWNYNVMFELMLGFGFKDTTVEYSTDGETWTALGDFVFARGTAKTGYEANTIVDFQGVAAKYVRLTAQSGYGMMGQFGLSEVQFMYIPVVAREPQPESGATDVEIGAALDWRSGREAASHQVYLGTEEAAVVDGTAPAATVSDSNYDPGVLTMDATYYWRIDEVNEAEAISTWAGPVWSFSTQEFVVVDDFEGYNDDVEAGTAIFDTWLDGWTNGTGSTVGYMNAPFAEQAVVHSGKQSMPLYYEGNSQADFTMDSQDWTAGGATTLVLYFRGSADNGAGQFYVTINNKKLTYPGGLTSPVWKQWNIDLASVGTNLAKVASFSVGVDGSGSGLLFVDDIRLYREAPAAIAPADPGTTGLAAYYKMEGNVQDSSGNNRHGTAFNDPTYAAAPTGFGQAIQFDGFADYVELPIGSVIASAQSMTISTRVLFAGTGNTWQRIFDFGTGATVYMFLSPNNGATNSPRFAITTSAGAGESIVTAPQGLAAGWHHIAVVIDAASMTVTLYVDGEAADSTATTTLPANLGATTQNWLARSQYTADPYFDGSLDEFQIYTRALSVGEVRYLAGDR
jgi:hypothetical protein